MVTYVQKKVEDYGNTEFFELDIMQGRQKIGYIELFVAYDEDGDEISAYVKSIEINAAHRNHGYGTEVLKRLAQEHYGIYIYPDNRDAERLYQRLGEKVDYSHIPDAWIAEYDESGIMYYID